MYIYRLTVIEYCLQILHLYIAKIYCGVTSRVSVIYYVTSLMLLHVRMLSLLEHCIAREKNGNKYIESKHFLCICF